MRSDRKIENIHCPRDAQQGWPSSTTTTPEGVGGKAQGSHPERRANGSEFQITRPLRA